MARLFLACIQDSITWKGDWLQIIHIVDNIRRQIQVLATILQQFFSPSTVRLFTSRHGECTRRGIGFDMKELNPEHPRRSLNMSAKAGPNTYGHLGRKYHLEQF